MMKTALWIDSIGIEDPCSDSTALGHEQIGLELTAERLGPNGARRSQAAGNALAFAVQAPNRAVNALSGAR